MYYKNYEPNNLQLCGVTKKQCIIINCPGTIHSLPYYNNNVYVWIENPHECIQNNKF